ncbi:MAG TPA: alcohol dehydrogenase catalytic domain-containing protein, partial [Actinomycetota bacterium]|nr:alcohol dehydrogenase catalytic domain-containing protein [Actinomycetota bacterium]
MKAVVYEKYGSATVQFTEVEKPVPTDDQVLIRIRASSVNGPDRESVFGRVPYGSQPPPGKHIRMGGRRQVSRRILGSDIAGQVEAVGKDNTEFKLGDEVFGEVGGYSGGFADY